MFSRNANSTDLFSLVNNGPVSLLSGAGGFQDRDFLLVIKNRSYLSLLSVDSIDLLSVREPRKGEWVHRSKFL
jgi:hypothetical protein